MQGKNKDELGKNNSSDAYLIQNICKNKFGRHVVIFIENHNSRWFAHLNQKKQNHSDMPQNITWTNYCITSFKTGLSEPISKMLQFCDDLLFILQEQRESIITLYILVVNTVYFSEMFLMNPKLPRYKI